MNSDFSRTDRISRQLSRMLSEIMLRESQDKRLQMVNITRVTVVPDLSLAKIYYTLMNEDEKAIEQALTRANGFLRSQLSKRLTTHRTPQLKFYYDDTLARARRIESLLKKQADIQNNTENM